MLSTLTMTDRLCNCQSFLKYINYFTTHLYMSLSRYNVSPDRWHSVDWIVHVVSVVFIA